MGQVTSPRSRAPSTAERTPAGAQARATRCLASVTPIPSLSSTSAQAARLVSVRHFARCPCVSSSTLVNPFCASTAAPVTATTSRAASTSLASRPARAAAIVPSASSAADSGVARCSIAAVAMPCLPLEIRRQDLVPSPQHTRTCVRVQGSSTPQQTGLP